MSINGRGAYAPVNAVSSGDVVKSGAVTSDGSVYDLSSATLSIIVLDVTNSDVSPKTIGTYSQTITDAANGLFSFEIPKEAFVNKNGCEMSYRLIKTENGNDVCLAQGPINVEEVY